MHTLEKASDLIHSNLKRKHRLLVHCHQGVSRSATAVLAYLIKYRKLSLSEALILVKKERPQIDPNPGFIVSLQELERKYPWVK